MKRNSKLNMVHASSVILVMLCIAGVVLMNGFSLQAEAQLPLLTSVRLSADQDSGVSNSDGITNFSLVETVGDGVRLNFELAGLFGPSPSGYLFGSYLYIHGAGNLGRGAPGTVVSDTLSEVDFFVSNLDDGGQHFPRDDGEYTLEAHRTDKSTSMIESGFITSILTIDTTPPTPTLVYKGNPNSGVRTMYFTAEDLNGIDKYEVRDNHNDCSAGGIIFAIAPGIVGQRSFTTYEENSPRPLEANTQDCFRVTDVAGNIAYIGTADAEEDDPPIFTVHPSWQSNQDLFPGDVYEIDLEEDRAGVDIDDIFLFPTVTDDTVDNPTLTYAVAVATDGSDPPSDCTDSAYTYDIDPNNTQLAYADFAIEGKVRICAKAVDRDGVVGNTSYSNPTEVLTLAFTPFISINVAPTDRNATRERTVTATVADADAVSDFEVATDVTKANCSASGTLNVTFNTYTNGEDHTVAANRHDCFRVTETATSTVFYASTESAMVPFSPVLRFDYDTRVDGDGVSSNSTDPWRFLLCGVTYRAINNAGAVEYTNSAGTTNMQVLTGFSPRSPECGTDINFARHLFSLPIPSTGEGRYALRVRHASVNDNAWSPITYVTYDVTPPDITVTTSTDTVTNAKVAYATAVEAHGIARFDVFSNIASANCNGAGVSGSTPTTYISGTSSDILGIHDCFRAIDVAGNVGYATTENAVEIPPPPTGISLHANSDSGIQDDDITNTPANQQFTFLVAGSFSIGETINLQIEDPTGTAISGTFFKQVAIGENSSVPVPVVAGTFTSNGVYTVTATHTDKEFEISAVSSPYTFTIERTAPTITIEDPDNRPLAEERTYTVTTTDTGGSGVDKVEYIDSHTGVCDTTTTGSWAEVSGNTHTVAASTMTCFRVTDVAGNTEFAVTPTVFTIALIPEHDSGILGNGITNWDSSNDFTFEVTGNFVVGSTFRFRDSTDNTIGVKTVVDGEETSFQISVNGVFFRRNEIYDFSTGFGEPYQAGTLTIDRIPPQLTVENSSGDPNFADRTFTISVSDTSSITVGYVDNVSSCDGDSGVFTDLPLVARSATRVVEANEMDCFRATDAAGNITYQSTPETTVPKFTTHPSWNESATVFSAGGLEIDREENRNGVTIASIFNAAVATDNSGVPTIAYAVATADIDGSGPIDDCSDTATYSYSLGATLAYDEIDNHGKVRACAQATDAAGNIAYSNATAVLTFDITPPAPTELQLVESQDTGQDSTDGITSFSSARSEGGRNYLDFKIKGDFIAGDDVQLFFTDESETTRSVVSTVATTGDTFIVGVDITDPVFTTGDGAYEVEATVEDSSASPLFTLLLDTTAPSVSVVNITGGTSDVSRNHIVTIEDANTLIFSDVADSVAVCTAVGTAGVTFEDFTSGEEHIVEADTQDCFRAIDIAGNATYVSTADAMVLEGPVIVSLLANLGGTAPPASTYDTGILNTDGITNLSTLTESVSLPGKYQFFVSAYPSLTPGSPEFPSEVATIDYEITSPDNTTVLIEDIGRSEFLTFREDGTDVQRDRDISFFDADGSYQLRARYEDGGGAYSLWSPVRTLVVDRTSPNLFVEGARGITAAEERTLTIVATDTHGIDKVEYLDNASSCDANTSGNFTSISLTTEGTATRVVEANEQDCFKATDVAGNITYTSSGEVTYAGPVIVSLLANLDETAPPASTYDTGILNTDGITNFSTLTESVSFSGKFEFFVSAYPSLTPGSPEFPARAETIDYEIIHPDGTVMLVEGIGRSVFLAFREDGTNVLQDRDISFFDADGSYRLRARYEDSGGTYSRWSPVGTLVVDRTGPTLLVEGISGVVVTEERTIVISAIDANGVDEVAYLDNASSCDANTVETFTPIIFTTAGTATHVIEANTQDCFRMTDIAGNIAYKNTADAVLDTTDPVITIGGFNNDAGLSDEVGFTKGKYPITVTDQTAVTVEYLDNAISCDASTTGSFQPFSGTEHVIELSTQTCFKATDSAGNVGYAITPVPPVATLIAAHDTGFASDDGITNRSPTLSYTLEITGSFAVNDQIRFYAPGGMSRGTKTIVAGEESGFQHTFNFPASDASFEGEVVLRANLPHIAILLTFTIDRTNPTLTVVDNSGDLVTEERTFTITASDAGGLDKVEHFDNVDSCNASTTGTPTTLTLTNGSTTQVVQANEMDCFKATDVAGNVTYAGTPASDSTLPSIVGVPTLVTNNTNTAIAKEGETITLTFTVSETLESDPEVTIAGDLADVTLGAGNTYTAVITVDGSTIEGAVTYAIGTLTDLGNNTHNPNPVTTEGATLVTVDTTDPLIDGTPTLTSDNTNTSLAILDDVLTLSFNTTEVLASAPTVTIAGQTVTATGVGTSYTAVITVNGSNQEGAATYDIGTLTDAAGNTSNPGSVTTTVVVDTSIPTLVGNPTLVTNNTNTKVAKTGETITLTFTVSETLASAPSVAIAGQTVTATGVGNTYTATITVGSSTTEGAVTYDIGTLTDAAGNTSNPAPVTTEGATLVTVDTINPTITLTDPNSSPVTADRTFTIATVDATTVTVEFINNHTGVCDATVTSGWATVSGSTHTVAANTQTCFRVTDAAGNQGFANTDAPDTTDPTITNPQWSTNATIFPSNVYTIDYADHLTSPAIGSIFTPATATDNIGVPTITYAVAHTTNGSDPSATCSDLSTYSYNLTAITYNTIALHGKVRVCASATDGGGNIAYSSPTPVLTVDLTPPAPTNVTLLEAHNSGSTADTITNRAANQPFTFTVTGTFAEDDTVSLHVTDSTGTAVGSSPFTETVGSTETNSINVDVPANTLTTDGTYTITATHTAYNQTSVATSDYTITVDRTNPTITLTDPNSGLVTADRTFTIATVDATTVTVEFINNHTGVCDATVTSGWATVSGSTHTVAANTQTCFRVTDAAGNQGFANTDAPDTTDPTITNPQWSTNATIFPSNVYTIDYADHLTSPTIGSIFTPATATDNIGVPTITYAVAHTTNGSDPSATCSDLSIYSYNLNAITYDSIALQGKVRVCASATDGGGNIAYSSPTPVLTVDLTPPAPATVVLLEAHNSGSTADTITNRAANQAFTFTITGTFTENDTVSLHVADSTSTPVSNSPFVKIVGSSETNSINVDVPANTLTADGTYTITATHTAYNQTSTATADYTITIDRTNPTITLTDPNSSPVTADRTFTIATVDATTVTVEFINNHTGVCDASVTSGWATVSGSTHTVAANTQTCFRATDVAGNQGFALTGTPDTTDPTITNPRWSTNNAIFPSNAYEIDYADHLTSPTIGSIFTPATATDNIGVPTITYAVATSTLNGTDPSATCSDLSTYSYNLSTITYDSIATHGKVRVCASATDGAGRTVYSTATPVLTVDLTPPAPTNVTLLEAHNSGSTADTITNRAANQLFTFTVTGTFAENDTVSLHVADSTSTAVSNSPFVETVGSSETGSIDIDVPANTLTTDGTYTITATHTAYNQTSVATSDYTITIDRTNPTITLTDPNSSPVTADRTFTIAVADTNGSGIDKTEYINNHTGVCDASVTSGWATVSGSTHSVAANTQTCFRATDVAGNQVFANTDAPDTTDPTITSPQWSTNNAIFPGDVYEIDYTDHLTNPTIGSIFTPATATDNIGVPIITYAVATSTLTGSDPSATCSDLSTYSYNLTAITYDSIATHGKVRVCASATDGAGRTVYSSPTPVLTVDLTPPAPGRPVLAPSRDSGAADGITNHSGGLSFRFNVTGRFFEGAKIRIHVKKPNEEVAVASISAVTVPAIYSGIQRLYAVNSDPNIFLTEGEYTVTATHEMNGQVSAPSPAYTVIIDRTIPTFTTDPAWIASASQFSNGFSINAAEDTAGPSMSDLFTQAVAEAGATLAYAKVTNSDFSTPPTDCTSAAFSYTLGNTLEYTDIDDQGTTQVCVRATDVAGNQAFFKVAEVLTFDTTVPGAPTNLALDSADDTSINSDRITSQFTNLTITGNNTAGSTVQVSTTSTFASPFTTDTNSSDTAFAIDITLPNNSTPAGVAHTIYVRELDANGNPSPTATLRITVDTTDPTIVGSPTLLTNNTDTTVAKVGETITLTFTVSETLASAPSVTIAGQTITATAVGNTYTAIITVNSATTEGAVTYDIGTLTDAAGNTTNPEPVTLAGVAEVVVDTINPTITLTDPNSGLVTADRTFTIATVDATTVTVEFLNNHTGACNTTTTGSWATVSGSTHTVDANTQTCFRATDAAGNRGFANTDAPDTTDPVITTNPLWSTNSTIFPGDVYTIDYTDHLTNPTIGSIFTPATATDNIGVPTITYAVAHTTNGSDPSATCSDLSTYSYNLNAITYDSIALHGKVRVCASATDGAGRTVYSTATPVLTVDLTPPAPATVVLLEAHNSGSTADTITNRAANQPFTFTVTGTFAENDTVSLHVEDADGSAVGSSPFTETVGSTETSSINIDVPANTLTTDGTYTVTATYTAYNQTSVASSAYTITVDRTIPAFTTNPAWIASASQFSNGFSINAAEDTAGPSMSDLFTQAVAEAGATLAYAKVTNSDFSTPPTDCTSAAFSYTLGNTLNYTDIDDQGTTQVCVRATDVAGNQAFFKVAEVLTFDTTVPGAPTNLALDSADDTSINSDRITSQFTGLTITGNNTAGSTVQVSTTSTFASPVTTDTNSSDTAFAIDITLPNNSTPAGVTHTIYVRELDANGNPSPTATLRITIDTTDPTIVGSPTLLTNNSDTTIAREGNTITLTFTVSETLASAPSVAIAGQTITATGVGNTYTAVITVDSATTEGAVTYDIDTLTDAAGNIFNPEPVTLAGVDEVVVDTTNPTITLTDPNSSPVTADRTFTIATVDATTVTVEFINNHTGVCDASVTSGWATVSGSTHTVAANTQTCFRATDVAGNQGFALTGTPDTTDPTITNPRWSTNNAIFPSNAYEIDYADHLTSPTIGSIFTPATATDNIGVPTITYAVATSTLNGTDPSATCSDLSTYSYNLSTITYDSIATHGKVRVCASATDGAGRTVYSTATPVLTVDLTPPAPTNVTLLEAHNSGSTADTITNRAANQLFTFTVTGTFAENDTVSLHVADSTGTAVGSSPFTETVGSTETNSINVDVPANTLTADGEYTITATHTAYNQTSAATADYTITIDRTIPTFTTDPAWIASASQFSNGFSINAAEDTAGPSMSDLFTQAVAEAGATLAYAAVTNSDFSTPPTDCTSAAFSYTLGNTLEYTDIDDQGTTQVCVRATDVAGNQAFFKVAEVLTFDTTVPGAPTNLALDSADDTSINSDRITSQFTNLTITGNNTAGSTVQVSTTSTFASPFTTDTNSSDTAFAIDITLPNNSTPAGVAHTIYVRELDANGNPSPTATLRITVDTTDPTIVGSPTLLTNNTDTTVAKVGETITLTFTVSETLASAPSVTIAGQTITATAVGNTYTAIITVNSSTTKGAVTYDINTLTDLAGNIANPTPVTSTVTVTRSSSGGSNGGGGESPEEPSDLLDDITAPSFGTEDNNEAHGFIIGNFVPDVAPTIGRYDQLSRTELIALLRQQLYELLQRIQALLLERFAARQAALLLPLQEIPPKEILFNTPLPPQPTGPISPFGRPSVGLPKEEAGTTVPSEGPSFGR